MTMRWFLDLIDRFTQRTVRRWRTSTAGAA
jgi:hypothetical protein